MVYRQIASVMFIVAICAGMGASAQTTAPVTEPAGTAMQHMAEKKPSQAGFDAWIESFKQRALGEYGFSRPFLNRAFDGAVFKDRVIELDQSQPHSKMTFAQYRQRVVPQSRINQARQQYRDNKVLLEKVAAQYGVQARFIVALWGVESNFGQNMGGFNIIESLATLAYDGRRASFFEKELVHALNIIKQGDVAVDAMKGSWAGAMGQTQFMPSSYQELAVDFDGDGKRDIWNNKGDAFASIANYLSKRGWDDSTTWGREVTLTKTLDEAAFGRKITKSLHEWERLGVRKMNGGALSTSRGDLQASIVRPEDDGAPYYLVYGNYNVLMNWNRSTYFATAVGLLSDAIGNRL